MDNILIFEWPFFIHEIWGEQISWQQDPGSKTIMNELPLSPYKKYTIYMIICKQMLMSGSADEKGHVFNTEGVGK